MDRLRSNLVVVLVGHSVQEVVSELQSVQVERKVPEAQRVLHSVREEPQERQLVQVPSVMAKVVLTEQEHLVQLDQ